MKNYYVLLFLLLTSFCGFSTTPLTGVFQVGTTNSVEVSWGETDVNLSSPDVSLHRYQLSYGALGESPILIDDISNTSRSYTLTGLTFGKTYEIRVVEVIRVNIPPSPFSPPFLENFNASAPLTVAVVAGNLPPVAVCRNITKRAGDGCSAMITAEEINAGSFDPENGMLTYSLNSVGPFGVGVHVVRLTVTDVGGLSSSCDARVTVVDDVAPLVGTKPATLFLDGSGAARLTLGDVTTGFSDNCGGISNVELSQTVFSCADLGVRQVTVSVTDNAGNVTRVQVQVNIEDNFFPEIIPQHQSFHLAENGYATLSQATLESMVGDNCGVVEVRASKTTFSCGDVGDNVVTITAKDRAGNETGATFVVTIRDITPPVARLKDAVVYLDGRGRGSLRVHDVNNGSTDNCGGDLAQIELSRTDFFCHDIGEPEVIVFLLDKSGNSTYARARVTVMDTIRPVVHIRSTDLYLGSDGRAILTIPLIDSLVADACGIVDVEFSQGEFTQAHLGANLVEVRAKDPSGNEGRATITVRVIDAIAPQVAVADLTLVADQSGKAMLATSQLAATIVEAGKLDSVYLSQTEFQYPQDSVCAVRLTAVDISGNVGVDTFMVSVKDTMVSRAVWKGVGTEPKVAMEHTNITQNLTGIEQQVWVAEDNHTFYTYGPNPTDGEIRLQFFEDILKVPEINLVDLTGRKLTLRNKPLLLNPRTVSIDTGSLEVGVYLLQVQQNFQFKTVKIMKR